MKNRFVLTGLIAVAATLIIAAPDAFATTFSVAAAATNTTAQTLGSGSGQTGSIAATGTLSVSGAAVAVSLTGNNATLTNLGSLLQTGTGRAIRDNTGVTGLTVTNGSSTNSTALMRTADGDVFQMAKATASVTLNNYGTMTSLNASAGGSQAVDFSAITSGSNVVNNFSTGNMQAAEADAVRPGVNGVVSNAGLIKSTTTTGSSSDGVDGQNNTGIAVTNSGTIDGARHGITAAALDATVNFAISVSNVSGGTIKGSNGSGLNIDGFNNKETATIGNAGLITGNGVTGDGDGIDVDGLVNLTNSGTIRSINSFSATAVPAQSEGVTVGGGTITNTGTIEGLVAVGNTHAVGRGITLAGIDTTGTAEPIYAHSSVTNSGLIRGQNDSAIAVGGAASGFTVTITNSTGGTLRGGGATAAVVQTGADSDTLNNAGTITADASGKAVNLGAGNDTMNITGGVASVTGDIDGGTGTNTLTIAPGAANAFSYSGKISNFSLEVQSGTVTLSGVSDYTGLTKISGGTLLLSGNNRLSASSALDLAGGTLEVNGSGANTQSFASLTLEQNSTIDLDGGSLSFDALGTVAAGKTLTLIDYNKFVSPVYAFRFLGDLTADTSFLRLMAGTLIDGLQTRFLFDGSYTDVSAVPEPATFGFALALLGTVGLRRRRPARA